MALKLKEADRLFSKCIRERAGWKCERCGSQHQEGTQGLHCSHFHGRGKWGVRFDPDNCESICYGCHQYLGSHPIEHEKRIREKLGDTLFEILNERARDTTLGRMAKRSEKEIRTHYRAELARLKEGGGKLENWC